MALSRLINSIRDNDVILWTGAGFSYYAGMPKVDKIKEAILAESTDEEKEILEGISSLSEMSQEFVDMRNGSRHPVVSILRKLIYKEPDSLKYHKLLAEIPQIKTIVSTNYDLLFEQAYGMNLAPIVQKSNIPYATADKVNLYKIHGDILNDDTMVITKDDYTNFFRDQDNVMWNKVKSLLAEKTIIFLGYSVSDQNIEYLVDNVLADLGPNIKESYFVSPAGAPPHKVRKLAKKNITYIPMSGEEFVETVHSEIKKK